GRQPHGARDRHRPRRRRRARPRARRPGGGRARGRGAGHREGPAQAHTQDHRTRRSPAPAHRLRRRGGPAPPPRRLPPGGGGRIPGRRGGDLRADGTPPGPVRRRTAAGPRPGRRRHRRHRSSRDRGSHGGHRRGGKQLTAPSTFGLSSEARNLHWLLTNLVEEVPGILSVAVVSSDGLLLLSSDADRVTAARAARAEKRTGPRGSAADLATIVSGIGSLTVGAAKLMDSGPVKHTMVAMDEGSLFVMSISDGSLLGVHGSAD